MIEDFFDYIRSNVIDAQAVVTMVELKTELESLMQSRGLEMSVTSKKLRRKIESQFGSTLVIFSDEKGKLLVMPGNLSMKETVKSKICLEKEVEKLKLKFVEILRIVDQSSMYIRDAILDMKCTTPWPILPSDLSIEEFPVPECLSRFLMGLLTNDPKMTNPSP